MREKESRKEVMNSCLKVTGCRYWEMSYRTDWVIRESIHV